jgi:hypothetical protein
MKKSLIASVVLVAGAGLPSGALPEIVLIPLPEKGRLAVFRPAFHKYVEVFGVLVVATAKTEDAKILHAGNVLAQYLDNDADGKPDNPEVVANLRKRGAFVAMAERERDFRRLRINWEKLERAGFELGQDLYGEETQPAGPPHLARRGRFDASLEEVLHLVSHGYEEVYPEAFRFRAGSKLADAMDLARGGRFRRIPRRYPASAWYHYDDDTCDYGCQCAEYFYWALTSILGGQDYPGRAREIDNEWELPTRALVAQRDKAVFQLLTNPKYRLPTVLPDGKYRKKAGQDQVAGTASRVLFKPNLDLLQAKSRAEHRRLGGQAPYFAHYQSGDRELVFLAARHEPRLGSPTHALVEAVIEGFKPDYVVVEGMATEAGPSPRGALRDARRRRKTGDCPEPLFAMVLAAEQKIPCIGGEPPAAATTAALRRLGSDRDALGFLLVRHLGQVRRGEALDAIEAKVKRSLPQLRRRFDLKVEMDLEDFKVWFLERSKTPWSADNLRGDVIAPLAGEKASYLQRMGIAVMLARERHLLALQARLLRVHRRVLVIYGSGHLVYEHDVLQQMLGKPVRKASRW